VTKTANDNHTDDDSERAKRLRTLARLARQGKVRPFDVVQSEDRSGERKEGAAR
jgi:hypothetical protein